MNMLHDPVTKVYVTEGHVPQNDFWLQVQSLGMVRPTGEVIQGYAERVSASAIKLLKKTVEQYPDIDPVPVTYLRY